jgi:hypothetical protein
MNNEQLLSLCQSKGLSEVPNDIAVYDDGFIYLQPIKIKGHDADNMIVGRVNERYSVSLSKGIIKAVKQRNRLLVCFLDGNYDEMINVVTRTGGEVLPSNWCFWRV